MSWKKFNDKFLLDLEEKCINALQAVQNSLDNINRLQYSRSSSTPPAINKLITAFQSHLQQLESADRDDIELLMTQCIEHWDNQKKSSTVQQTESHLRYFTEKITMTLNLLQASKKIVIPSVMNEVKPSFDQQMSKLIAVSPSSSGSSIFPLIKIKWIVSFLDSLKRIASVAQPSSSKTDSHSKEQLGTPESPEITTPMRCRRIPYTFSEEKTSATSLHQVVICSTAHTPLQSIDSDGQNSTDLLNVSKENPKAKSDVQNNPVQIERLDSLLSKMSNNIESTMSRRSKALSHFSMN